MPETRFTEFPALSVDQRLCYLGLHRRAIIDYFSYLLLNKTVLFPHFFYNILRITVNSERHSEFSLRRVSVVCKQQT